MIHRSCLRQNRLNMGFITIIIAIPRAYISRHLGYVSADNRFIPRKLQTNMFAIPIAATCAPQKMVANAAQHVAIKPAIVCVPDFVPNWCIELSQGFGMANAIPFHDFEMRGIIMDTKQPGRMAWLFLIFNTAAICKQIRRPLSLLLRKTQCF